MHTFFWGCWGLFIVVRSCLFSLQSKPHKLAEQATQACWTSLSGLLDKPFLLVEQVSRNVVGKSGPSSRLGAHARGWALPSLGMCMWISWTRQWAYWAYWALFHNLSSSFLFYFIFILFFAIILFIFYPERGSKNTCISTPAAFRARRKYSRSLALWESRRRRALLDGTLDKAWWFH